MKLQANEQTCPTPLFGIFLPTDEEITRYGTMRDDYRRKCKAEPFSNRCLMALCIGARAFGIAVPQLQAARDRTRPRLDEDRQRLMAFSRVVSMGEPKTLNTWKGIARAFHRQHPAAITATHKYGAQIAAAMEMNR